jgi:hypothetical protein
VNAVVHAIRLANAMTAKLAQQRKLAQAFSNCVAAVLFKIVLIVRRASQRVLLNL